MRSLSLRNAPINGGDKGKFGVFKKGEDGGFVWTPKGNGRTVVPQPMVMKKDGNDYLLFPVNGKGMPEFAKMAPMPGSISKRLQAQSNGQAEEKGTV